MNNSTNFFSYRFCPLTVCLFGFLTSSWTTRLYRGRTPRQSVWQFYVLPHMRQSWETMTSVSAGHIILTPTQPVGSGRPQRESSPGPPHQESRALPTEVLRPLPWQSDAKVWIRQRGRYQDRSVRGQQIKIRWKTSQGLKQSWQLFYSQNVKFLWNVCFESQWFPASPGHGASATIRKILISRLKIETRIYGSYACRSSKNFRWKWKSESHYKRFYRF